ncbi:hypothetical protein FQN60_017225 [Etheostoma spectabile]|uniref:BHLH domain-containing protein n=1 Tax=Etheostoma spectabile TaxID=54343 RepID=A0A5J5DEV6_9PERO|nr:hypothetical protein FQN60_017225 [Etheostoma spectabile]
MNRSLESLKTLLLQRQEGTQRRVEKAEILEHTVVFLQNTAEGNRRELEVVMVRVEEPETLLPRRFSPACKQPLSSWALRGRACGLEQHWIHHLLLRFPTQSSDSARPKN